MEQQINELRDPDIIDGDLGLIVTCDDQVPLLGPSQLWTPSGYAVDTTAGDVSIR